MSASVGAWSTPAMADAAVATGSPSRHSREIRSRSRRIHERNVYSRHMMPGSESGSDRLHSSAIMSTPSRSTSVSTRSTTCGSAE